MTELQQEIKRAMEEIYAEHQEPKDYMASTMEIAESVGKGTESVGCSLSWMRSARIVVSLRVKGSSGMHRVWAFAKGPNDASPEVG